MLKVTTLSINTGLDSSYFVSKHRYQLLAWNRLNDSCYCCLQVIQRARSISIRYDFDGLCIILSEMSKSFSSDSFAGLPQRSASYTDLVLRNLSTRLRTALRCGTGLSGSFSVNRYRTTSVYLSPSRNTCSTSHARSSVVKTILGL